ncbi:MULTISPECIES: exonuclease domain-containing protein [unclassified Mammaliicoccus]|uniref:exonuclease domain-containing protein n=1 Tax=unclassified Mammaliicoccus TaxID=2803851 RepID=UPI001EFA4A64|nr:MULTISPECIES: exonuclease domain-containing protein [unclassified Mammaliicoccus]
MKKYDIAVLDFETMNEYTNSPCEIAISLIKDLKISEEFSTYINPPNNKYSLSNAKIHKISKEVILNSPTFENIYPKIISLIESAQIVIAHNANFDISVLNSTIETCNLEKQNFIYIDSVNLFKYFHGNISVSMDSLCDLYNIDKTKLHSAKYDVHSLSTILIKLAKFQETSSVLELIQSMKKQYIRFSNLTNIQRSLSKVAFTKPDMKLSDINKITPDNEENLLLKNKNIVFTGEFNISKSELMILTRKIGANIRSTVSPRTHILVEGVQDEKYMDENGLVSKQRKARELIAKGCQIQLINEKELLNYINGDYK